MTRLFMGAFGISLLCTAFLFATLTHAQQETQNAPQRVPAYDLNHEVTVVGTVISFSQTSQTPPLGAHVVLQVGSGSLDVHLGNARLLDANHFTLNSGDTVRVIGETVPFGAGTQFMARIIQKGSQAVLLRSPQGFPLRPTTKAEGRVL
jgi:DNA/RNA endonuclease YhcR with UshA esterase domain